MQKLALTQDTEPGMPAWPGSIFCGADQVRPAVGCGSGEGSTAGPGSGEGSSAGRDPGKEGRATDALDGAPARPVMLSAASAAAVAVRRSNIQSPRSHIQSLPDSVGLPSHEENDHSYWERSWPGP